MRAPAAAAALLLAAGCIPFSSGKGYLGERLRDLADPFVIDAAGGAGLSVQARLSCLHSGLGYGQMYHLGILENPGRHATIGLRPEASGDAILYQVERTLPGTPNAITEDPVRLAWLDHEPQESHRCWLLHAPFAPGPEPRGRWLDLLDVRAGANVLFLGGRIGFRPGEALDFLAGWLLIDLSGDDAK